MKPSYRVHAVEPARRIATALMQAWDLRAATTFGLPEVDDRYHLWRVPVLAAAGSIVVGEVVIDARSGEIDERRTTQRAILTERLRVRPAAADGIDRPQSSGPPGRADPPPALSPLPNTIALGDAEMVLTDLPAGSVDLVFSSPPYFNARPGYTEYASYGEYLDTLRRVIRNCHRALAEGRFFVLNVAPVLVRRPSRQRASRRLAVPFDVHALAIAEGFEFLDDIIWEKPEGAGWATGRGRRFAADRQPLQYKPVPVTEYVLVYRRRSDRLIDWHLRRHPDRQAVKDSRILGDYDRTNIWRIKPASSRQHPAVFPVALAERVIRYYSFRGDVVLDPFAGIGTTGAAAVSLGRRFVLIEREAEYVQEIRRQAADWIRRGAGPVVCQGCPPVGDGTGPLDDLPLFNGKTGGWPL